MEQTINLFSKGLLLDTNPMVQSNDTLSDALNATFITQNGNEVILLNDMGNRRVDNAYLPPGYEPVGMKEYGGIIYIAAYNPITGKSQIGSFPSPERKISKSDDDNLGGEVDFIEDFRDAVKTEYSLYWLTDDTLLYPLTNKNSIHAGDKFVVYGFNNPDSISNVTNYNNISGDKVYTPLNKTYTLQLGVLNSLNEFVDITKTLVRWDEFNNKISFDKDITDLYKFNSGYFLAKGAEGNNDLSNTINDANFIDERIALKLALNTYAYKLVGPLYLKAILNHIEGFNYDIYGTYENNSEVKSAELVIDGYITYNCPHKFKNFPKSVEDEDYITYDDGEIIASFDNSDVNTTNFFDFYYRYGNNKTDSEMLTPIEIENEEIIVGETKYDKITNLYTTKITKNYKISSDKIFTEKENNVTSDKLYFIIGVCTPLLERKEDKEVYLEGLSVIDVLNLSLLGSGKVFPKEWRFYNDIENRTTKLVYNLNSYPKVGERLVNLSMELYNVENSEVLVDTIPLSDTVYNGRVTKEFNWLGTKIESKKLYYVRLKWYIQNKETEKIDIENPQYTSLEEYPIWFLSTPLFNSCFNKKDDFIECYFNPRNDEEKNILNKKQLVELEIIVDDTKSIDNTTTNSDGTIITKEVNKKKPYIIRNQRLIRYYLDPKIVIKNPDNYPDFVELNSLVKAEVRSKLNIQYLYKYKNEIYSIGDSENVEGLIEDLNRDLIRDNIKYNGEIPSDREEEIKIHQHKMDDFTTDIILVNNNIFSCKRISDNTTITNVFDSILNTIGKIVDRLVKNRYGGQVILDYDKVSSSTTVNNLAVAVFFFNNMPNRLADYENISDGGGMFGCEFDTADADYSNKPYAEGIYVSDKLILAPGISADTILSLRTAIASSLSSDIYSYFNEKFPKTSLSFPDFLFLFNNENGGSQALSVDGYRFDLNCEDWSRVWWRTSDDRWALINLPLKMAHQNRTDENLVKSKLTDFFNNFFTTEFVYCFASEITALDAELYVPIKNTISYTIPYDFKVQIYVNLSCELSCVTQLINTNGIEKPLKFVSDGKIEKLKELDTCNIKSSEEFYDIIHNTTYSNIYLPTCQSVDLDGTVLKPNCLYTMRLEKMYDGAAGKIEIKENSPYNRILYNPQHEKEEYVSLYRYDIDAPEATVPIYLDYKGILTTPKTI